MTWPSLGWLGTLHYGIRVVGSTLDLHGIEVYRYRVDNERIMRANEQQDEFNVKLM
jgi:hypothetical protein